MKKIITLFIFVLMVSCEDGKKTNNDYMKPTSTGRINHIIVVVEPDIWSGKAGEELKKVIKEPLVGLPQLEYQFGVSTIPPKAFSKMFKNSKNLLVLQLSDKVTFRTTTNKYAQPQTILEVKAPNVEALIQLIDEKKQEIISTFKNEDLKSIQRENKDNLYKQKIETLTKLGVQIDIPNKYRVVMDTLGSFMWVRSHIAGGIASGDQTNNILVYQTSMFHKDKPVVEQIIKNRDSIGKLFIRGNDPDKMYMITEAARKPVTKIVSIGGLKAFETRGTWEVFGAFNAGPFLNYSIIDEKHNRVLVVEGFNYAPSVNKRDFMFELEAILKTTQIE